jgi:DNA-binding beta-propeller fold protein YncE
VATIEFVKLIPQAMSTFAGDGQPSFNDGPALSASFYYPYGIAVDSDGNLFIADSYNHRIRKINTTGYVTTIAGDGRYAFADGQGLSASFYLPTGIALDSAGNLYVADCINNRIRKINSTGYVTTIAGDGQPAFNDGQGLIASFYNPYGIAVDSNGNLFIADTENNMIRKINSTGYVSTLAGDGRPAFNDSSVGVFASFMRPADISVDSTGNLYIADCNNNRIRKINAASFVSTSAGDGRSAFNDGVGVFASFNLPAGTALDSGGNLYIAEYYNNRIRKILGVIAV